MKWWKLCSLALALAVAAPASAGAGQECDCKIIKKAGQGWCSPCESGLILGQRTDSKKIYMILAGTEIPEGKQSKCQGCIEAKKADGYCTQCHVAFVKNRIYKSKPAYVLALGKIIPHDKQPDCQGCVKALKAGHGYCKSCGGGIVAHRWFEGEKSYDKAVKAYQIVTKALKAIDECESCAIGLLTDGECKGCGVQFEHGEKKKVG